MIEEVTARQVRVDTAPLVRLKDARYREVSAQWQGADYKIVAPESFGEFLEDQRIDKVSLHYLTADRTVSLSSDKEAITIGDKVFSAKEVKKALGLGTEVKALNRWRREEKHERVEISQYYVPIYDEKSQTMAVVKLCLEDYGRLRDVVFETGSLPQKHPERIESPGSGLVRSTVEARDGSQKEVQSLESEHWLTAGAYTFKYKFEHASSVGAREVDEDFTADVAFQIQDDPTGQELMLVNLNDGMGGHSSGDEASVVAWEAAREALRGRWGKPGQEQRRLLFDSEDKVYKLYNSETGQYDILGADLNGEAGKNFVKALGREANKAVYDWNSESRKKVRDWVDGGTTFVGGLVVGNKVFIGNVGDSRAYKDVGSDQYIQFTQDHSGTGIKLARGMITPEEAAEDYEWQGLYRFLGKGDEVEVDIFEQVLGIDDSLLLTCDGNADAFNEEYLLEGQAPKKMSAAAAKGAKNLVVEAVKNQDPKDGDNCSAVKIALSQVRLREYKHPAQALAVLTDFLEQVTPVTLKDEKTQHRAVLSFGLKQLGEMLKAGAIPEADHAKYIRLFRDVTAKFGS